jgi:hypothetical protein
MQLLDHPLIVFDLARCMLKCSHGVLTKENPMESRSLVPHTSAFRLPIANMRNVFLPDDVERKLAKLPERDHESLRSMYQRMLERGPERFQVKPSGVPDMGALYDLLPNFHDVLDDVKRHVALSHRQPRRAGGHPHAAAGAAGHWQDTLRARSWPGSWAPA